MGEERLPRRVMFGEMLGGKGHSGGQEWDWMKDLEEKLKAFGIKFEGRREAAHKVGKWFRRVEEGADVFMRKRHKDEKEATADRHRTVATAIPTGDANARARAGGEDGGGGEARRERERGVHLSARVTMAPAYRSATVLLGSLLTLPMQVLSFATVPTLAGKGRHQRFLQSDVITPRIATPNKAGFARGRESAIKAGFATARGGRGGGGGGGKTLTSILTRRGPTPSWRRRHLDSSRLRVLGDGGGCDSEDECEIIYDDDEDLVAPAATATATADAVADETAVTTTTTTTTEAKAGQDEVGEGGDVGRERAGLDHREKVLDDGFQKQDMLKWRDAEVLENSAASADERSRLLTLGLVGGDGLEYEFSRAAWLDNYKVPGQFVGVRLDSGGDDGVAGCLVAVSMEPTSVRQSGGKIQVLVTEEATFRLKGDTRGPAEEARGRSLAALEEGDKVKLSDFMGRGFSSLFVGWIGLQSALQEKRDIVIVASGARGLGSIKPVLDWPPVQAHAGIKQVSVYLEDESPVSAAFLNDFMAWRSSGIRVTQCFTSETPGTPSNVEAAIFSGDHGLRAAVGGDPGAASFLIAGLPGKRAMELTDRLTDQGVDASRLLFNEFF